MSNTESRQHFIKVYWIYETSINTWHRGISLHEIMCPWNVTDKATETLKNSKEFQTLATIKRDVAPFFKFHRNSHQSNKR
jgi:inosine-uridine nucleoside N-ribohydrolase